jgi:protein SCO1/2
MKLPLGLAFTLSLLFIACSRTDQAAASHDIRGEIVGLDRARGVLMIHHEEIPGYMPAMTMEFTAAGIDLAKLREGQRLTARMGAPVDGVFPLTAFRLLESSEHKAIAAAALALRQDTSIRGKNAYREIGETAPSFTLYNQDGRAVSFDTFRGKRVVLNFIFTRCPVATMCPASTAKMIALQSAAKSAGVKNLELVSISFDSAFDTPPVLKAYAQTRSIDISNFSFLTGPESAIRDLLAQFGVIAEPGENVFKHTLSTLLIGADGKILHRADGSTWSSDDFLKRL